MLQITNLNKEFSNGVKAVSDLSLEVDRGQIYCMLGANGAGKTTTINLIFNFIFPSSGTIKIMDVDVNKNPLEAKKHLAYVSENVMLYDNLTAVQNLEFFTKIGRNNNISELDFHSMLKNVGLDESKFDMRIKTFSKGMRQKCGIAIAMAKNVDCIILDEPTSGLDPKSGREFLDLLLLLREQGKIIFMTTHDLYRAKEVADYVGIMSYGKLMRQLNNVDVAKGDLEKIYMEHYNN